MIGIDVVYLLLGLMFAAVARLTLQDRSNPRRITSALFWGLFAASFLFGKWIGDLANGAIAVSLALVAALSGLGKGDGATTDGAAR